MGSQREKRRREIILKAMRVFIEKGIDNTSMEDLAKAIGKTKSYFYFYFRSKEDLIINIFQYLKEEALRQLEDRLEGVESPKERLEIWIREHFRQVKENPDFLRFVYSFVFSSMAKRMNVVEYLKRKDRYFSLLNSIIVQGQEDGVFIGGDVDAISHAIRGAIYGSMRYLFDNPTDFKSKVEAVEEAVVRMLTEGLLR
ncbi:MAG: TetR/AcrR family transcriptional regulator [Thermotogae bacterium]|nr:TetR/AcrR family transcriptional regulator [Thermotogota bacterium]